MKRKQKRKAHPPLHQIKQHPWGRVQAKRRGRAADPITEKQERKFSKNINGIVSEAKEDAEKHRRNEAKENREK
jgi:hypothetical protein